jgi:hypothetical protein
MPTNNVIKSKQPKYLCLWICISDEFSHCVSVVNIAIRQESKHRTMTKNETNTAPRREMKQTSHEDEKSNNVARRRGNHKNKKKHKRQF